MIKNVIRWPQKDMVIVFDEHGEQMPEYQGPYKEVKEKVLADAPPEAIFGHIIAALQRVPREEW